MQNEYLTDKELREKIDICVKMCPDCSGSGYITKGFERSQCWRCKGKKYVIDYDQILALLQPKIEELRAEIEALHRERKGEVWYWQGDGEDKLESLTCPVLIEAQELKDLIEEARRQERERIASWLTRKVYADGLLIPHDIVQAIRDGGEIPDV